MRTTIASIALLLVPWCARAADDPLSFEVASIRTVPDIGYPGLGVSRGGPGTADPGRLTFEHATLKLFVMAAYGLQSFQVSGPEWIAGDRFDIIAKVPAGASKDQANRMLQNLLAERFKLTVHHETRAFPAYELTVGKGGPKMRPSPGDAKSLTAGDYAELKTVDGILQFPPGTVGMARGGGAIGVMLAAAHQPVSKLVEFLQSRLGKPVIDKTGLTGNYDFVLKFTPTGWYGPAKDGPSDPSADEFTAVQRDLGLKLDETKAPFDVVVIDHAEKTPTEN
ncbi:MAG TPA: TIGR03435 family protein [Bryobacteraceae bacterium]